MSSILPLTERFVDPAAVPDVGIVYAKDVAGITQLFYVADDGTVTQLTPLTPAPVASARMFYGTTTGVDSEGNDYVAAVAVGADVPFPRDGGFTGGAITRSSATAFLINTTGLYRISWSVGFVEVSQLQVTVNGVPVARTTSLSGAINQINSNSVLLALAATDLVTIRNPAGNPAALTVEPAASLTHAQAPSLTIEFIA